MLCYSGRRFTVFLIQWFSSLRLMLQQTSRQLPWSSPRQMFLPSSLKRRQSVRRGHPLRSRKDHFVVCEGCAMWISAATPGGSGGDGALDQHQRLRPHTGSFSIRDPSRLVVTCNKQGHTLDRCVMHAPSCTSPSQSWTMVGKHGSHTPQDFQASSGKDHHD